MLSRIAHDIYWLGRDMARAEHTARILDSLFQAELGGRPDDPRSISISWRGVLALIGSKPAADGGEPTRRDDVVRTLTADPENPSSIVACVRAARERGRTLRDTISIEMWEALNTFHLELRRGDLHARLYTGPYSIYRYVRERAALFWGLSAITMQRDDAHAFLIAGSRVEAADMVLRMLRVALPPVRPTDDQSEERPRRDGNALALLRAVGGFQAFMRSAAAPPNATPVARFLLFEPDFPESVAASVDALHRALRRLEHGANDSPAALRVSRLLADLELRRLSAGGPDSLPPAFREVQQELERAEDEIADHYFQPERAALRPAVTG